MGQPPLLAAACTCSAARSSVRSTARVPTAQLPSRGTAVRLSEPLPTLLPGVCVSSVHFPLGCILFHCFPGWLQQAPGLCALPHAGQSVLGFGLAVPVDVQWSLVTTGTQNLFLSLYQAQHEGLLCGAWQWAGSSTRSGASTQ